MAREERLSSRAETPDENSAHLPKSVRVSSIFIDESGSKNSAGGFFVLGMVKTRNTPSLARALRALRQKHNFTSEAKFGGINSRNMTFFLDAVELLAASDVRIGGSVYDSHHSFFPDVPTWKMQARMSKQLVIGNTNKNEVVNVFLDLVQTPIGDSVAQEVFDSVNQYFGSRSVIAAYDLDSKSTDLLQMADLVAGSIAYERKSWVGHTPDAPREPSTPKAHVARRLRRAFDLDSFDDVRQGKVNILTMRGTSPVQPPLDGMGL